MGTGRRDAKRPRRIGGAVNSTTQTQTLDQRCVARIVLGLEVVEQTAALADHLEPAAARMMILRVALEMLGEVGDACGQDRDLHFRRTGIAFALGIRLDELRLALGCDRHRTLLKLKVENAYRLKSHAVGTDESDQLAACFGANQ